MQDHPAAIQALQGSVVICCLVSMVLFVPAIAAVVDHERLR
jgi:hypothetical protein